MGDSRLGIETVESKPKKSVGEFALLGVGFRRDRDAMSVPARPRIVIV